MSENTKIEWCDHTFNPWTGCLKVSPGCDHCYAEGWSKRAGAKVGKWGPGAPRVRTTAANWKLPMKWEAGAKAFQAEHGRRQRVFCASLADVFDNEVDPQWRTDLFDLIHATPNLDWLLLTKRIGNAKKMLPSSTSNEEAQDFATLFPNAWLGATVVNQEEADRDIPKLLATPARVRFLSMEPLLGPVSLSAAYMRHCQKEGQWEAAQALDGLHWVIAGGESGPGARPSHPDWYRSLRNQCAAAGVPFLFKQWGEWTTVDESPVHPEATRLPGNLCRVTHDGVTADHYVAISTNGGRMRYELRRVGKKAAGRLLDGIEHNGFPS